ncbi:hypothetical protein F2Q70_00005250 [Brassica cretica]|uniref:Uncharacterized protein n=1 Tax=Brassica cretica TaxID=69181 RepID=A0A8S9IKK4_BRACR|nr:hypothetical protein F2Q70_00005250 [Brassica cretica]
MVSHPPRVRSTNDETRVKISNHSLPPESARKHDDGTPPTAETNRGESAQPRNSHPDRRRRPRLTDRSFASGYSNAYNRSNYFEIPE